MMPWDSQCLGTQSSDTICGIATHPYGLWFLDDDLECQFVVRFYSQRAVALAASTIYLLTIIGGLTSGPNIFAQINGFLMVVAAVVNAGTVVMLIHAFTQRNQLVAAAHIDTTTAASWPQRILVLLANAASWERILLLQYAVTALICFMYVFGKDKCAGAGTGRAIERENALCARSIQSEGVYVALLYISCLMFPIRWPLYVAANVCQLAILFGVRFLPGTPAVNTLLVVSYALVVSVATAIFLVMRYVREVALRDVFLREMDKQAALQQQEVLRNRQEQLLLQWVPLPALDQVALLSQDGEHVWGWTATTAVLVLELFRTSECMWQSPCDAADLFAHVVRAIDAHYVSISRLSASILKCHVEGDACAMVAPDAEDTGLLLATALLVCRACDGDAMESYVTGRGMGTNLFLSPGTSDESVVPLDFVSDASLLPQPFVNKAKRATCLRSALCVGYGGATVMSVTGNLAPVGPALDGALAMLAAPWDGHVALATRAALAQALGGDAAFTALAEACGAPGLDCPPEVTLRGADLLNSTQNLAVAPLVEAGGYVPTTIAIVDADAAQTQCTDASANSLLRSLNNNLSTMSSEAATVSVEHKSQQTAASTSAATVEWSPRNVEMRRVAWAACWLPLYRFCDDDVERSYWAAEHAKIPRVEVVVTSMGAVGSGAVIVAVCLMYGQTALSAVTDPLVCALLSASVALANLGVAGTLRWCPQWWADGRTKEALLTAHAVLHFLFAAWFTAAVFVSEPSTSVLGDGQLVWLFTLLSLGATRPRRSSPLLHWIFDAIVASSFLVMAFVYPHPVKSTRILNIVFAITGALATLILSGLEEQACRSTYALGVEVEDIEQHLVVVTAAVDALLTKVNQSNPAALFVARAQQKSFRARSLRALQPPTRRAALNPLMSTSVATASPDLEFLLLDFRLRPSTAPLGSSLSILQSKGASLPACVSAAKAFLKCVEELLIEHDGAVRIVKATSRSLLLLRGAPLGPRRGGHKSRGRGFDATSLVKVAIDISRSVAPRHAAVVRSWVDSGPLVGVLLGSSSVSMEFFGPTLERARAMLTAAEWGSSHASGRVLCYGGDMGRCVDSDDDAAQPSSKAVLELHPWKLRGYPLAHAASIVAPMGDTRR